MMGLNVTFKIIQATSPNDIAPWNRYSWPYLENQVACSFSFLITNAKEHVRSRQTSDASLPPRHLLLRPLVPSSTYLASISPPRSTSEVEITRFHAFEDSRVTFRPTERLTAGPTLWKSCQSTNQNPALETSFYICAMGFGTQLLVIKWWSRAEQSSKWTIKANKSADD